MEEKWSLDKLHRIVIQTTSWNLTEKQSASIIDEIIKQSGHTLEEYIDYVLEKAKIIKEAMEILEIK